MLCKMATYPHKVFLNFNESHRRKDGVFFQYRSLQGNFVYSSEVRGQGQLQTITPEASNDPRKDQLSNLCHSASRETLHLFHARFILCQ